MCLTLNIRISFAKISQSQSTAYYYICILCKENAHHEEKCAVFWLFLAWLQVSMILEAEVQKMNQLSSNGTRAFCLCTGMLHIWLYICVFGLYLPKLLSLAVLFFSSVSLSLLYFLFFQIVHPQKRRVIRHLLDGLIGRCVTHSLLLSLPLSLPSRPSSPGVLFLLVISHFSCRTVRLTRRQMKKIWPVWFHQQ